jgi:hypothetical protein
VRLTGAKAPDFTPNRSMVRARYRLSTALAHEFSSNVIERYWSEGRGSCSLLCCVRFARSKM